MFKRSTLDAVGGQLYPWSRRSLAASGQGSDVPMTGTRSRRTKTNRAQATFPLARAFFPYRGLHR